VSDVAEPTAASGVTAAKEWPGGDGAHVSVVAGDGRTSTAELHYPETVGRWRRQRARVAAWPSLVFLGLVAALTTALLARGVADVPVTRLVGLIAVCTATWVIALYAAAVPVRARGFDPLTAAAIGTVVGISVLGMLDHLILGTAMSPGTLLLMGGGVFTLAATLQGVTSPGLKRRRRAIFLMAEETAEGFIQKLDDPTISVHLDCVGVVADHLDAFEAGTAKLLGRIDELVDVVRRVRPDLLVIPSKADRTEIVDRLLDEGVMSVRVVDWVDLEERLYHRVPAVQTSPSWFASLLDLHRASYSASAKRAFDVSVASIAFLVLLPLFVVIWIALRCTDGPVFYRQTRSGEGGKPFQVIKFRTMIPNAETGAPVWASERDPRVTRIGRILRKTRLDELPQFWNVFRGEMSIVGPRPERPEYLALLEREVPFWSRRLLLKPGITGWAQLHFGYASDISGAATKLSYDLYYLKHRSLSFDILILLATFRLLLTGRGAR
jgi:exopolysaccharide biosynthesis polyprenyl glycosylphosphotransferase